MYKNIYIYTRLCSSSSLESTGAIILDLFLVAFFSLLLTFFLVLDSLGEDFEDSNSSLVSVFFSTVNSFSFWSSSLDTSFNFFFASLFLGVLFTSLVFLFFLVAVCGVLLFLFSFSLVVAIGDSLIFGVPRI